MGNEQGARGAILKVLFKQFFRNNFKVRGIVTKEIEDALSPYHACLNVVETPSYGYIEESFRNL